MYLDLLIRNILCNNAIKPPKNKPRKVIASMCLYYSNVFSCGQIVQNLSKNIEVFFM